MFSKSILAILGCIVAGILSAPADVPPEKLQPTVIPIVSQSDEFEPNGTYKFSYETGNGIYREETAYEKLLPQERGGSSNEGGEDDDDSNEIHVQRGSYSYTAPDGTIISVSYIADENGFQPIETHITRSSVSRAGFSSVEKSGRALKIADSSESASAPAVPKIVENPTPPGDKESKSETSQLAAKILPAAEETKPVPAASPEEVKIQSVSSSAAGENKFESNIAQAVETNEPAPVPTTPDVIEAKPQATKIVETPTPTSNNELKSETNQLAANILPAAEEAKPEPPSAAAPEEVKIQSVSSSAAQENKSESNITPATETNEPASMPAIADVTEAKIRDEVSTTENAAESNSLVIKSEQGTTETAEVIESSTSGLEASEATSANIDVSTEAASSAVSAQSTTESAPASTASAEQGSTSISEQTTPDEVSEQSSSTSAPEPTSSGEVLGQSASTVPANQSTTEEAGQPSTNAPELASTEESSSTTSAA